MKQVDYSTKTYDILNDDNEEMHDFHIQSLCNDEGDVIGWKYILGEDGERIYLEDCICNAYYANDCGCACNSWTEVDYEDCNEVYEEDFKSYLGRWQ